VGCSGGLRGDGGEVTRPFSWSGAGSPDHATPSPPVPPPAPPRLQPTIKFRTVQLEHEFGCPFQLGHHAHANGVEDADLATFPVAKGDVVVMGSDGLLDNLSDQVGGGAAPARWCAGTSALAPAPRRGASGARLQRRPPPGQRQQRTSSAACPAVPLTPTVSPRALLLPWPALPRPRPRRRSWTL
jgi:hypothetical protein